MHHDGMTIVERLMGGFAQASTWTIELSEMTLELHDRPSRSPDRMVRPMGGHPGFTTGLLGHRKQWTLPPDGTAGDDHAGVDRSKPPLGDCMEADPDCFLLHAGTVDAPVEPEISIPRPGSRRTRPPFRCLGKPAIDEVRVPSRRGMAGN